MFVHIVGMNEDKTYPTVNRWPVNNLCSMFYGENSYYLLFHITDFLRKVSICYRLVPLTYLYEMKQHMSNLHLIHCRRIFDIDCIV